MSTIFVARSATISQWGSDVGLSKHIYKVGVTDMAVRDAVAQGWAGETDWVLVRKQDGVDLAEEAVIERLATKAKLIEPRLYPRIKEATGLFKVLPAHVENHLLVASALAGDALKAVKVKPADFGTYLIVNATS